MPVLVKIILYSLVSGIPVFVGGLLAFYFEKKFRRGIIKEEFTHTAIAFGGGVLVAAVAFVLVPEGMTRVHVVPMSVLFFSGAISFFFLDRYIERKGGTFAQVLAMLSDFVPEAIALGAVFGTDSRLGLLLALFIGLQNLPESFNSYFDLKNSGYTASTCLRILLALSFPGVIGAVSGFYLLGDAPVFTAALMLFSGGGIIYLLFQNIAPMSKLKRNWFPALGASLGFLVGMIGLKVLG